MICKQVAVVVAKKAAMDVEAVETFTASVWCSMSLEKEMMPKSAKCKKCLMTVMMIIPMSQVGEMLMVRISNESTS